MGVRNEKQRQATYKKDFVTNIDSKEVGQAKLVVET